MIWFEQDIPPDDDADDYAPAFWDNYWDCDCCSYPDRTGDVRSVIKPSDFYSVRQWHSTGLYTDYYRPYGVEHDLAMILPAGPGPVPGPGQTVRLASADGDARCGSGIRPPAAPTAMHGAALGSGRRPPRRRTPAR
jgi:hypothetical protein